MPVKPEPTQFYPHDRAAWRAWLTENHATEPAVWLIFFKKKSGKPSLTYDEAVEESLCFGWIDSKPNKIDDESFMQFYCPRKPKSGWSKVNKIRIEHLLAEGKMMPAGLEKIEAAKRDGSWTVLDAIEELIIPTDLAALLAENEAARGFFQAFPSSVKKQIFYWIESAKTDPTRQKRLLETVSLAEKNIRANQYVPKK